MTEPDSIKQRFIYGVIWGIVEKLASLLTGFVVTLILARILTPADYGLVNMIYIFTVLGTVLLDGGFGQAIIQRQSVSATDISSVFYINIGLSIIIYIALFYAAPLIAEFYRQPLLVSVSRVVFITIPINALCVIQHSLLTKELKVKELTYVSIISAFISGCVGIFFAYKDFGVWALVYQSISYQSARVILLWKFSDWRPILDFSIAFIKSIWGFSMNMLCVFSFAAIFQNIYTLIIGKLYNVNEVGYYNQAFRMQTIASNAIMSSIQRVAFPAFAHFQDDLSALKYAYKRVMTITMSFYFPIMMSLVVISRNLFEVLLTDKWLSSVPMFCLLCVAESLYPLNNINSAVLKAIGLGKKYARLNISNYAIISTSILLTYKYGILGLLIGYAVSAIIRSIISMIVCGNEMNYPIFQQLKDVFPIFVTAVITCIAVFFANHLPVSGIWRLVAAFAAGAATFATINIMMKSLLFYELKSFLHK